MKTQKLASRRSGRNLSQISTDSFCIHYENITQNNLDQCCRICCAIPIPTSFWHWLFFLLEDTSLIQLFEPHLKKPLLASSSPYLWVLVEPLSSLCLQHTLSPETFLSSANYLWLSIEILHSIYSARLPAANTDFRDCHPEKSLSYAYLKHLLFLSDLDTVLILTSTLEILHLKWFLGNQAEMLNCGWASALELKRETQKKAR